MWLADAVEFAKRTPWQIPLTRNLHILAVITEPEEVRRTLRHLVKVGRPPPGFNPTSLNLSTPFLSRGITLSARRSLRFLKAVFLAWSPRLNSREVRLSRDWLCAAEDYRKNCLDRLDGR
jgi:hypothetical protein